MKLIYMLIILFFSSLLHAEERSLKLTFGSNLGNIPLEINKINKNKKQSMGLKVNNWILSPNIFSLAGNKILSGFPKKKNSKDKLYFKLNFKF